MKCGILTVWHQHKLPLVTRRPDTLSQLTSRTQLLSAVITLNKAKSQNGKYSFYPFPSYFLHILMTEVTSHLTQHIFIKPWNSTLARAWRRWLFFRRNTLCAPGVHCKHYYKLPKAARDVLGLRESWKGHPDQLHEASPRQLVTGKEDTASSCAKASSGWIPGRTLTG